ncbi:DUF3732 domain-containing protein [Bacillus wiedmannii]|uniref:DUF3732 domain-containing protein n=1 Tax=Bacillus wiedmannii TaxID=1890302 RepID=UPI000D0331F6|nr:DUF3732 domain-containing protein [Bacillus wiedmannii]PRT29284.1 hypothetical protein C6358_25020 [Bacillus wiedmannii]PRT40538.1 hypothetical protein C6359_25045 [Bacillus wiedmannii]
MKRWNVKKIFLYSHHEEMREIEFNLEDVTIITGDSQTGKSAIPEIIDYLMGASQCHIPSYVRSCISWVGILWVKGNTNFSFFRRVPQLGRKSSQEVYFDIGMNLKIPQKASEINKTTNLEGGLNQFENLLGIGNVRTESFVKNTKSKRISVRNTMPYLLQDDDVIISKNTLLRGANEAEKKQSILQSLPYFFGVIDETILEKELEYKKIKKQIQRIEREIQTNNIIIDGVGTQTLSLVQESAQLGLCKKANFEIYPIEDLEKILHDIVKWDITKDSLVIEDKIPELHEVLAEEQAKAVQVRNKIRSARIKLNTVEEFDKTANKQKNKLEVINIFKDPMDSHTCPLCNSELIGEVQTVTTIKELLGKVKVDLGGIERDRPKLDSYIQRLKAELDVIELKIESLKNQIQTLVKENESTENKFNILERRYRTIGRISLYLEAIVHNKGESTNKDLELLESLTAKSNLLYDEVNIEERVEALENIERRISSIATQIISELPFESRYKDNPIYINLKNLNVGVALPTHSESMRDVGSDENYLSLHVACVLAMHRQFAQLKSAVPGVILFDQLSRPYFPPDKEPEEVQLDTERSTLLTFFETLFKEVDRGESLQIIVLEHAYFRKHKRYKSSVKYRWKKGESGLIPKGWPEK